MAKSKKKFFLIIIYLLFSSFMKAQNRIIEVVVYKNFFNAGSTNSLIYAFKNPNEYNQMINDTIVKNIDVFKWHIILKNARIRKHRQMKISNISFAGYMRMDDDSVHYYIVCTDKLIIDLTKKRNYWVEEKDKKILNEMTSEIKMLKIY